MDGLGCCLAARWDNKAFTRLARPAMSGVVGAMVWCPPPYTMLLRYSPVSSFHLEEGRLVAPFPALALAARSYYWYCPARNLGDEVVQAFCAWLEEARGPRHANVNTVSASGNEGNAA